MPYFFQIAAMRALYVCAASGEGVVVRRRPIASRLHMYSSAATAAKSVAKSSGETPVNTPETAVWLKTVVRISAAYVNWTSWISVLCAGSGGG